MAAKGKQTPKGLPADDQVKDSTEAEVAEAAKAKEDEEKEEARAAAEAELDEKGEDFDPAVDDSSTPNVEVEIETVPDVEASSPWEKVEMLSDGEMTFEALNVTAYQHSMLLLRVRLKGELTGKVITLDRMKYKTHDGTIKAA